MSKEFQRLPLPRTTTAGRFVQHEASTAHRLCREFGGVVRVPDVLGEKIDTDKPPPVRISTKHRQPVFI